jgi:hypothetical protein
MAQVGTGTGVASLLPSGWRLCTVALLVFVVAAVASALRKDVTKGFDEVAHVSYIAELQQSGSIWPDLKTLRMLDPVSFRFTRELNYLNHPAHYYLMLAHLGPDLEGHPRAIVVFRLFNVMLAATALAAWMTVGLMAGWPRPVLYAYLVPILAVPVLIQLAGAVNNDNATLAGGGIATLAAWTLIETGKRTALLAALAGVVIAAWAKFTGLLLVGGMVGGVVVWLIWRGRFRPGWIVPIALAVAFATAPYAALFAEYASPTPSTPGHIVLLKAGAHAIGSDQAERMSLAAYAVEFLETFVSEWMPSLAPRNWMNHAALAIPATAVACAFAGLVASAVRIARGQEGPIDVVVASGAVAFISVLVVHCAFSYQRYQMFGSLIDAYPRYYLSLAAIVPLAGVSLLSAIDNRRVRAVLIVFLTGGPLAFGLLGAPSG